MGAVARDQVGGTSGDESSSPVDQAGFMAKDRTPRSSTVSTRTLLEAGGGFAGGAFLAGTYFGIAGAILGSLLGFAVVLLTTKTSTTRVQ